MGLDAFPTIACAQVAPADETPRTAALEGLPWDAALVVGASVLRMRGVAAPERARQVVIAEEAGTRLEEPSFRYDGFTMSGLIVTGYDRQPTIPNAVALGAILMFTDDLGRRATTSLAVDYAVARRRLDVVHASVRPISPRRPDVKTFLVPAAEFPEARFANLGTGDGLLRDVAAKALKVETTPRTPQPLTDYYAFAFFLDRMPLDAQIRLRVSETPDGIEGHPANAVGYDLQGWRVAVMRASFGLNVSPRLFFKVVYQPGGDAPADERTPRLAAVFSNYPAADASEALK